jgi:hypothetical protein
MSKLDSFGIPQVDPDVLFAHSSLHFYGPPGSGKTLLLGSVQDIEELCPALILDTEGSTSVLAGKIDPEKLHIRRINQWNKGVIGMLEYLANEPKDHGYKTVCIDTFAGLQQLMVREAGRVREMKGGNMNNALNMGTPTEADWGAIGSSMIKVLDAFNKAPFLFVTTAHHVVDGKEIRPALQGKMAPNDLPGRPYMVAYMDVIPPGTAPNKGQNPVPVAYFGYHTVNGRKTWAKDRSGKINGGLLAPTMRKIYDRVNTNDN